MLKKILLILTLLLFTSNSGYSPLYSIKKGHDLNIQITDYEKDKKINSIIKSRLRIYDDENSRVFKIKIVTNYEKSDLSKDTAGTIDQYQLKAIIKFSISSGAFNRTISFEEEISMKNFIDDFEEKNYENKIKADFATNISKKLIIQLLKVK